MCLELQKKKKKKAKKAFVLGKGLGAGRPRQFFTLGICRFEGVSEDLGFES